MLVDATMLIQDIQLLCFTVIFGVLALQQWKDLTRRWLWFSFLANTAGAILDLLGAHRPYWLYRGVKQAMIPLSYALINVACVYFGRRGRLAIWLSAGILVATLPVFLLWSSRPVQFPNESLGDLAIALECLVAAALLSSARERSNRAPRLLMSAFLVPFAGVELLRAYVALVLHADPDLWSPKLEITSAVAYIVNTSVLPLAFVWMMNARLEWGLLQQSLIDPLTEVLNRRGLEQGLERELAWYHRYGNELTLAMLDMDHFKQFNDRFGHAAGDQVLHNAAKLFSARLRDTDLIARWGGEEFVLALPHTTAAEGRLLLEGLCRALHDESGHLPFTPVATTASFGVTSTHGRPLIQAAELLHEADMALYSAKQKGRNQVCFYAPMDEATPLVAPLEAGSSAVQ